MRKLFLMITILLVNLVSAQQLDTIYANEKKTVALFFPKPIRQGAVGRQHFVFNYNRSAAQHLGLLQATPGEESNLLAITDDGQVYSYILKYADKLSTLNYFIKASESIGIEKPFKKKEITALKEVQPMDGFGFPVSYRLEYIKKYAEFILKRPGVLLKSKRKKGMILRVYKLVYNRSEVYVHLEIENRSGIDFEIDALNVYKISGNKRKKNSFQKVSIKPFLTYDFSNMIRDNKRTQFIYVVPKFTLGDVEKLLIELHELNGSRNIILSSKQSNVAQKE